LNNDLEFYKSLIGGKIVNIGYKPTEYGLYDTIIKIRDTQGKLHTIYGWASEQGGLVLDKKYKLDF
jgi:hypothetical protein